ncbi:MAG TPA: translocation/assembly module TamB domain-containing protein [Stellaceae bacterium]|jgi:translocation and assembly module TamB|nr:translocation/assembly module TamB domain-containing protein [Stellaceae bacterium]
MGILMWRVVRWLGIAVLAVIVLIGGALALLQTSPVLNWAGGKVMQIVSAPGFSVTLHGLGGHIPFDLRAQRIEVSDDHGVWLALDNADIDLAPSALLSGRVQINSLSAAAIDVARLPETKPQPNPKPVPLAQLLRLPRLPVAVAVDRLAVDRLTLGPTILGDTMQAAIAGHAVQHGDASEVALDLHRTDGVGGGVQLNLKESGAAPDLSVQVSASEPSGVLLGSLLHRDDKPPLSLSFTGEGPLAAWNGRLEAAAGELAKFDGAVTMKAARDTVIGLDGTAALAPLLTPEVAALTGDSMPVSVQATLKENGAIAVNSLSVGMAAGRLTGDADFAEPDRTIAAHLRAELTKLGAATPLVGQPTHGSAEVTATVSGTENRPQLEIAASGDGMQVADFGAQRANVNLKVGWNGDPADPSSQIDISAGGSVSGIAIPQKVPQDIGRDLEWSLQARAARDASTVTLSELAVKGAGIDITGTGNLAEAGQKLDGRLHVAVADLRPFTALFGHQVDGALALDATAQQQAPDHVTAKIDGSITGLHSGIAAADALTGSSVAIAGAAEREASGDLVLDRLSVVGAGVNVSAIGRYNPASRHLSAVVDAAIPHLQPLGAALGTALGGQLSARLGADGSLDQPRLQAHVEGHGITAGTAALERVQLEAEIADPTQRRVTVDGDFAATGVDGTLSLEADAANPAVLAIPRFRLSAAGSVIDAALRIDLATLLTQGTVTGKLPDLGRWSRLSGIPVAGSVDFKAGLEARGGQALDLTLNGDRLASGAGGSRVGVNHVAITARLSDLLGTPGGTARANLNGATFSGGNLTTASLTVDGPRPGHFAFTANAAGTVHDPVSVALDGNAEFAPRGAAIDVRVNRLAGAFGPDHFRLTRPLVLAKHGEDLALSDLALTYGSGQISGGAARRGSSLSLQLNARNLPVALAGRFAGNKDISGTVGLAASVTGSLAAPQGRFSFTGQNLRLALPKQPRLPTLGVAVDGSWNGRELALNGRVTGIKADRLGLTGTVPLVLTAQPFGLSVPPQGRLALRVQGGGELADISDLLPLGEDRVTGKFALDGAVNGMPSAPSAGGQLTLTDGRYENFATGAVLTHLRVNVAGDRDRVTLREFSANDTGQGTLAVRGSVLLTGGAPRAELAATLQGFRVLGRDDATLAASGTVNIAGEIASPKVTAQLVTQDGELRIPDSLPPSVTKINVVEINGHHARRPPAAPAKPSKPALPAILDIGIDLPGHIFVRGRGLDSEWRGKFRIAGTSEAPQIRGSLNVVRGTFDFLGKTFKVTHGSIGFNGAAAIDPSLDITTEIVADDITAQVIISGSASSPKITMTSTPVVPQDEILSRVLFNRGIGQITAAEGIQVAQAAATLAGGGPGVLDRLRGKLGLDRLAFGSAPSGVASSNLNPASGGSAAGGTAVSGGKYVAEGVYVGAAQGLTPQTSKVVVEIEVRPHVTVEGDFSQSGGSGLGLNYKYDY